MLAVNFFWFWTTTTQWVSKGDTQSQNQVKAEDKTQTQTVSVLKVDEVSDKLISSWAWEILLSWVLVVSILFAYFTKKIA